MIITPEELRKKYKELWPVSLPVEALDRNYIIPTEDEYDICHQQCSIYKNMVFTPEIEDCDDYALQYYSEFKRKWARWTANDKFADTSVNIIRKYHYHVPIAITTGIKFRGEMELPSHTVTSTLLQSGIIIFDPLRRLKYKADPKQELLLRISMP